MMKGFRLLAALKGLRGTAVRPVRLQRRAAHGAAACSPQYEADLELDRAARWRRRKIEAAAALASVPALIRGYGHVKQAAAEKPEPNGKVYGTPDGDPACGRLAGCRIARKETPAAIGRPADRPSPVRAGAIPWISFKHLLNAGMTLVDRHSGSLK